MPGKRGCKYISAILLDPFDGYVGFFLVQEVEALFGVLGEIDYPEIGEHTNHTCYLQDCQ